MQIFQTEAEARDYARQNPTYAPTHVWAVVRFNRPYEGGFQWGIIPYWIRDQAAQYGGRVIGVETGAPPAG